MATLFDLDVQIEEAMITDAVAEASRWLSCTITCDIEY